MKRYAVVVGSNGPAQAGALKFAAADAERIQKALGGYRCNFEIISPSNTENPLDIERIVSKAAQQCRENDTFLIYFSGHGFVDRGSLLLMLDNTSYSEPLTSALHAETLLRAMRFCKARHKIIILDCCHAGIVFSDSRFKSAVGAPVEDLIAASKAESESFIAILASDRLERARELDILQGGFLTSAVCDALGSRILDADRDRDGAIDMSDLKIWLTEQALLHNQKNPDSSVPIPFVFGKERGRLFLTREPDHWKPVFVDGPNGHRFSVLPARASASAAWLISTTPVTNRQYAEFVRATSHRVPIGEHLVKGERGMRWEGPFEPWSDPNFNDPNKPVVCVDFLDCITYARWLKTVPWPESNGFVPMISGLSVALTEVWDFAAFGQIYPSFDRRSWQTGPIYDKASAPAVVSEANERANKFGVIDLFGNVWEWTYQEGNFSNLTRFATVSGYTDEQDDWRMRNQELRGGSFLDDLSSIKPSISVGSLRDRQRTVHSDLGFRLTARMRLSEFENQAWLGLQLRDTIGDNEPFHSLAATA